MCSAQTCVVDTMQTNCYNANGVIAAPPPGQPYYGQDAQCYGNQSSYTLSGDGKTVHDHNTGLCRRKMPPIIVATAAGGSRTPRSWRASSIIRMRPTTTACRPLTRCYSTAVLPHRSSVAVGQRKECGQSWAADLFTVVTGGLNVGLVIGLSIVMVFVCAACWLPPTPMVYCPAATSRTPSLFTNAN